MNEIFYDLLEWMIVISENILVLATDYDDAAQKMMIVLDRCGERNLYLKLSKSKFGMKSIEFFGYLCSHNSYKLTEDRVNQVNSIPLPSDKKSMQRFLGAAMYFKPLNSDYSRKQHV